MLLSVKFKLKRSLPKSRRDLWWNSFISTLSEYSKVPAAVRVRDIIGPDTTDTLEPGNFDWLEVPVEDWESYLAYVDFVTYVNNKAVVNDAAKRCVENNEIKLESLSSEWSCWWSQKIFRLSWLELRSPTVSWTTRWGRGRRKVSWR